LYSRGDKKIEKKIDGNKFKVVLSRLNLFCAGLMEALKGRVYAIVFIQLFQLIHFFKKTKLFSSFVDVH
jgi:hypothetical protein